jgi:hypothetical protein
MKASTQREFFRMSFGAAILAAVLLGATSIVFARSSAPNQSAAQDQSNSADKTADSKPSDSAQTDPGMTKLRIRVTDPNGKAVGNASVYVRYYTSGGLLRHEKLEELDLKTNQDGSVKVPEIPQGKILIQVIAKGWHTYGKWYEIQQSEQSVPIKLEPPPHWY